MSKEHANTRHRAGTRDSSRPAGASTSRPDGTAHRRRARRGTQRGRNTMILATTKVEDVDASWRSSPPRAPRSEASTGPRVRRSSATPTRTTGSGCSSTGTARAGRASSPTPTPRRSCRWPGTWANPRPRSSSGGTTPRQLDSGVARPDRRCRHGLRLAAATSRRDSARLPGDALEHRRRSYQIRRPACSIEGSGTGTGPGSPQVGPWHGRGYRG
jgi:hypothetical protein